jgi:hypothetical protein
MPRPDTQMGKDLKGTGLGGVSKQLLQSGTWKHLATCLRNPGNCFHLWGLSQSFCFVFDLALFTSQAAWAGVDTTLTQPWPMWVRDGGQANSYPSEKGTVVEGGLTFSSFPGSMGLAEESEGTGTL